MTTTRARSHLAHTVVLATVALHVAAFVATAGAARTWLALTTSLVATIAVAQALRRRTVLERASWSCVLAGLLLLVVHNATALLGAGASSGLPGTVRTFAMPIAYLLIGAAVVGLMLRVTRHDRGSVIEAAIIALGSSLTAWVLVVDPLLDPDLTDAVRLRTMVLVVICGAIAGAVSQVVVVLPHRRTSTLYIVVALLASFAGVLARNLTLTPDQPRGVGWAQLLWVLAYASIAGSVLHPSVAGAAPVGTAPPVRRLSRTRTVLLGAALAVGPATALGQALAPVTRTPKAFVAGITIVMVALVVVRINGLARQHEGIQDRLTHLASHDPLTGLPNRRTLDHRLADLLGRVRAGSSPGAVVLFVDLDDFKSVNDRYGHTVGDELLRVVADRLRAAVRGARDGARTPCDLVARPAGDEFVVVIEAPPSAADGSAQRIRTALTGDVGVAGHVLALRAAVGVATARPGEQITGDRLLGTADHRMYAAKRAGRAAPARFAGGAPDEETVPRSTSPHDRLSGRLPPPIPRT